MPPIWRYVRRSLRRRSLVVLIPLFALSLSPSPLLLLLLHSQDSITENWLETCYKAYSSNGYMFEKYNAFEMGIGGGGGEYTPQIGFGWSNGVALVMLNLSAVPKPPPATDDDPLTDPIFKGLSIVEVVFVLLAFVAGLGSIFYAGLKIFLFILKISQQNDHQALNRMVSLSPTEDESY
jgi:hypothetical protein